jgi:hypothetical protein
MYLKLVSSGSQLLPSVDLLPGRAAVRDHDPSSARPFLTVEYKPEISQQVEITCVARTKVVLVQREGSDDFEVLARGHITHLRIGDEITVVDKRPPDSPYQLPDEPQVSYILAVSNEVRHAQPSMQEQHRPERHSPSHHCLQAPPQGPIAQTPAGPLLSGKNMLDAKLLPLRQMVAYS